MECISGPENTCADLLSRLPDDQNNLKAGTDNEPNINDNIYEINVFNSNRFDTREYASCSVTDEKQQGKPSIDIPDLNITVEQSKDK